jgi:hypothetical protein
VKISLSRQFELNGEADEKLTLGGEIAPLKTKWRSQR